MMGSSGGIGPARAKRKVMPSAAPGFFITTHSERRISWGYKLWQAVILDGIDDNTCVKSPRDGGHVLLTPFGFEPSFEFQTKQLLW